MEWRDNHPVVFVSDTGCDKAYTVMRIRTISPNAAGRHFIRHNLARRIAEGHFETDNPFSRNYMNVEDWMVKRFRNYERAAEIVVIKKGEPCK